MKDSYIAKVVYFNKYKEFDADGHGNTTEELSQAMPYFGNQDDRILIMDYDDEYKKQAEVWKVKITVETIE